MSQQPELTVDEQKVNNLWEAHLRTEFNAHSADDAIATMVANQSPLSYSPPKLGRGESPPEISRLHLLSGRLAGSLTMAAILGSAGLLLLDAGPPLINLFHLLAIHLSYAWARLGHAPLSALPLLLAGASYAILQALLRPAPLELLRRLTLAAAFLLWGIVQLMPANVLATDLGDLVIALYVFDLGLMVQAELQRS